MISQSDSQVEVLVLRGAPGVGKSSQARLIRERFSQGFVVEADDLQSMFVPPDWHNRTNYKLAIRLALQTCNFFIELGRKIGCLVLVGTDRYLEQIQEWSHQGTKCKLTVITLWAQQEVLRQRIEERARVRKRVLDPAIIAHYLDINDRLSESGQAPQRFIDTSFLSPKAVFLKITELWAPISKGKVDVLK